MNICNVGSKKKIQATDSASLMSHSVQMKAHRQPTNGLLIEKRAAVGKDVITGNLNIFKLMLSGCAHG